MTDIQLYVYLIGFVFFFIIILVSLYNLFYLNKIADFEIKNFFGLLQVL